MASQQERTEFDAKAKQRETFVSGDTGDKSLEAQEHFAEGRSWGGQKWREQIGMEGFQEMSHKGGLNTMNQLGGERVAQEGIDTDESKYRTC